MKRAINWHWAEKHGLPPREQPSNKDAENEKESPVGKDKEKDDEKEFPAEKDKEKGDEEKEPPTGKDKEGEVAQKEVESGWEHLDTYQDDEHADEDDEPEDK